MEFYGITTGGYAKRQVALLPLKINPSVVNKCKETLSLGWQASKNKFRVISTRVALAVNVYENTHIYHILRKLN